MIKGERIRLRAIEPDDSKSYLEWINDPETNQWRGLYPPTSQAQAADWIQHQTESRSDRLAFAIEVKGRDAAQTLIGFIGLSSICTRSRRAELWIYLGDKSRWGAGFGQDSVRTLCQYAFEEMNLFRIWIQCDPEHVSAVKCYEKVGFIKEGTLRQAYYRRGAFRDTCMMGLLRTDMPDRKV